MNIYIYIVGDWNLEPDFGKSQYPEKDPVFAGQISIKKKKTHVILRFAELFTVIIT